MQWLGCLLGVLTGIAVLHFFFQDIDDGRFDAAQWFVAVNPADGAGAVKVGSVKEGEPGELLDGALVVKFWHEGDGVGIVEQVAVHIAVVGLHQPIIRVVVLQSFVMLLGEVGFKVIQERILQNIRYSDAGALGQRMIFMDHKDHLAFKKFGECQMVVRDAVEKVGFIDVGVMNDSEIEVPLNDIAQDVPAFCFGAFDGEFWIGGMQLEQGRQK